MPKEKRVIIDLMLTRAGSTLDRYNSNIIRSLIEIALSSNRSLGLKKEKRIPKDKREAPTDIDTKEVYRIANKLRT